MALFSHSFQLDKVDNPNYVEVTELLPNVSEPETSTTLTRLNTLQDFILPDLNEYYTYHGSLTTPPCSEVVTWIDFKQSIPLSHAQVANNYLIHSILLKHLEKIYKHILFIRMVRR